MTNDLHHFCTYPGLVLRFLISYTAWFCTRRRRIILGKQREMNCQFYFTTPYKECFKQYICCLLKRSSFKMWWTGREVIPMCQPAYTCTCLRVKASSTRLKTSHSQLIATANRGWRCFFAVKNLNQGLTPKKVSSACPTPVQTQQLFLFFLQIYLLKYVCSLFLSIFEGK